MMDDLFERNSTALRIWQAAQRDLPSPLGGERENLAMCCNATGELRPICFVGELNDCRGSQDGYTAANQLML
jgi:hypothetical protein